MLCFIGDTHGNFGFFRNLPKVIPNELNITFIQVGDFGLWPDMMKSWPDDFPWKVYFIHGNHDSWNMYHNWNSISKVANNLFYVPNGTMLELEGLKIGFMGGGESLDRSMRTEGFDWWPQERVTLHDVGVFLKKIKKVDVLVSHTPPLNVIQRHWPPVSKFYWKLPEDWSDVSSLSVEYLRNELDLPPTICGHMHKSVLDGNVRILDINEPYFWCGDITKNEVKYDRLAAKIS